MTRQRDPERPKRPGGAFLRFLEDFRKKQAGKLKGTEVMKAAAVDWKKLSSAKRLPFVSSSEADLKVYRKKMDEYIQSGQRDAWRRDPARPKRPLTPFFKFAAELRSKHPDQKVTEQMKRAAQEWKLMGATDKADYEKDFAEEKQRYLEAMEAYKTSGQEKAWEDKVGITQLRAKAEASRLKKQKLAAALKKKMAKGKKELAATTAKKQTGEKLVKQKAEIGKKKVAKEQMA